MKHANKLWETHRTLDHHTAMFVSPKLQSTAVVEPQLQEAMSKRKNLTFIVGESDGEHTVKGRVIGFRAESGGSLQIRNEWGRFLIPISNIVRVF